MGVESNFIFIFGLDLKMSSILRSSSRKLCSKVPACAKNARESSLAVKGALLFNMCPEGLGDMASDHQDRFKENLDAWLHGIPDQPTIPGCHRAANTNSLLHQVPVLLQQFDNP